MDVCHQENCPHFRCERSANQKQQCIEQMLSERRRDDMGETAIRSPPFFLEG
jgi:hypothetical protein